MVLKQVNLNYLKNIKSVRFEMMSMRIGIKTYIYWEGA